MLCFLFYWQSIESDVVGTGVVVVVIEVVAPTTPLPPLCIEEEFVFDDDPETEVGGDGSGGGTGAICEDDGDGTR